MVTVNPATTSISDIKVRNRNVAVPNAGNSTSSSRQTTNRPTYSK